MVFLKLLVAQNKMYMRNRQTLFWLIVFPLIFMVALGIFLDVDLEASTLAVIDRADDEMSRALVGGLDGIEGLELRHMTDEAEARRQVFDGELGFALVLPEDFTATARSSPPARITMIYDNTRPFGRIVIGFVESFVSRANMEMAGVQPTITLATEQVSGLNLRLLDTTMPGIAIWGVMSFSVLGIATALTTYREKRILVRIDATPLKVSVFFVAKVVSYMILALIQITILLGVAALVFGAKLSGNPLHIALIVVFANMVFLNMGFIVAAFSRTTAAASGLGNVIILPLLLLSGVFFPTDILPDPVRYVVEFLPLSPALVTMRGIVLEARPIWDFPVELATIACWLVVTALVATRTFKFR